MPAALEFIRAWETESEGERPYVVVRCWGEPVKVSIGHAFRHIRENRHILDVSRRFRLLPCVKELLKECTEAPVPTQDGNWMLEGKAPTKERFRVVIGQGEIEPGTYGYKLVTFYPFNPERK